MPLPPSRRLGSLEEHSLSAFAAASSGTSPLEGGVLDSPSLLADASLDEGEAPRQRRIPSRGSIEGQGGLSMVREGSGSLGRSAPREVGRPAAPPRQLPPCSPPPRVYVVRQVHSVTAD